MNEVSTSKGILKYRNPNVFENMEMLRSTREFFQNGDVIGAKIEIMKKLAPLMDYSGLEGISSFEELCSHGEEMTYPLSEIADYVLQKVSEAFQKKS